MSRPTRTARPSHASSNGPSSHEASSSELNPPAALQVSHAFFDTLHRFGFHLQSLTLSPTESSGICPMNIYHCLAMVAAGSKDNNLAAFSRTLNFDTSDIDAMLTNSINLDAYGKSSTAVEFSSASSVWHRASFVLGVPWKELVQKRFNATVGIVDLHAINAFIERETKGKIKDLITDVSSVELMLITCLYFKANWAKPFERAQTVDKSTFYGFQEEAQNCAMMKMFEYMEYENNADSQICVLPYESQKAAPGPRWKAAIILPKARGLDAMRTMLTSFTTSPEMLRTALHGPSDGSSKLGGGHREMKVSLSLPRFSLKLTLDMIPALSKLGLGPIFTASPDFAPISSGPLKIGRATHDLVIEVNEEGTEVAAVTVLTMLRSMPRYEVMTVDRPFLFIVFDAETGLVLCQIVVNELPKAETSKSR